MVNDVIKIRLDILELIYNLSLENGFSPIDPSDINESFSEKQFLFNVQYLNQKKLLDVMYAEDGPYLITLTADGVDVVELYRLGISLDSQDKESTLHKMLNKLLNSGSEIVQQSALTLVNSFIASWIS